jgi:effector-binding domain-containing protein
MTATLNFVHEPVPADFPASHYVFVERVGHIPANAPQAWHTVEKFAAPLMQQNQITGAAAFYKPTQGIYRAGFMLSGVPVDLPEDLRYEKMPGGKYTRFTLTGPFDQLPEANTRAFAIVAEQRIPLRDGFNIEHYLTDPRTTPADQNVTAILIPIA